MRAWMAIAAAAGAALTAAVPAGAQNAPAHPPMMVPWDGTRLDVVATGEARRVPDVAVISAGVVTDAPTAQQALADNNRRMEAVFAALQRAGIAERDIQTASVNLNPRYDYSNDREPQLLGYSASNQLSVTFRDIERAGAIIDALVAEGVNQVNGPSLQVDEPEEALDEARRDALTRARARAELYAEAVGMRVARIVAISEAGGGAQPPMPMMRMQADAAEASSLQIAPGEQRLTATVTVTFALE